MNNHSSIESNKFPLLWEKLSDNRSAHLVTKKIRSIRGISYKIALLKILDISLLSAKFNEEIVLFKPIISIFLDFNGNIDFLGIYNPSDPEEEDNKPVPSFCMRRCSWSRKKRHRAFKENDFDFINDYLLGEKQIDSRITFWDWTDFPELQSLVQECMDLFRNGLAIERFARDEPKLSYINCYVSQYSFSSEIGYTLYQNRCIDFEEIIPKIFKAADLIESESEFIPDRDYGLRISYRSSLEEYLNIFQEKLKP